MEILPAILPKSYADLTEKLSLVSSLASMVQIDICDGKFVPSKTWPYVGDDESHFGKIVKEEEGFPLWEEIDFEVDLMIDKPENHIDNWITAGAKRGIIHIESTEDIQSVVENFRSKHKKGEEDAFNIELGIALNINTPVSELRPIISQIDFIQCMGIEKIGFQGQVFDERVLGKIEDVRKQFPNVTIQVDGGVNFESAPRLLSAGASRLVVGSALFESSDIKATLNKFKGLV